MRAAGIIQVGLIGSEKNALRNLSSLGVLAIVPDTAGSLNCSAIMEKLDASAFTLKTASETIEKAIMPTIRNEFFSLYPGIKDAILRCGIIQMFLLKILFCPRLLYRKLAKGENGQPFSTEKTTSATDPVSGDTYSLEKGLPVKSTATWFPSSSPIHGAFKGMSGAETPLTDESANSLFTALAGT